MRWPLQPLQPFQQTQLQPPFGQSVDSLCHPWFTTTNVSYRFPILILPPPPCAVLLVYIYIYTIFMYVRSSYPPFMNSIAMENPPIFKNRKSSIFMVEGSLEVKLPTIWRDQKAVSREKSQKRKDQKKEDAGARKGRKVAKHCVFSWFCGSGGLKSRLAKPAGAETSGEMRDEQLHAVVARSRFRSEKAQNTSASDHFWKLRCWNKSARHCGAKQIWK